MDPKSLDQLRCTRTRVAKRIPAKQVIPSSRQSSTSTSNNDMVSPQVDDPSNRDFARFLGENHPLHIIFVGHNPSDQSWKQSAPYAHKSNRFWKLMKEAKLAPEELCESYHFSKLPNAVGIGFIDLFVTSGSDASLVNKNAEKESEWRHEFFDRLNNGTSNTPPKILCCVSKIVARKLLGGWNGDYGSVGNGEKWGFEDLKETDIWVLPSTSGRAGLTWQQRLEPFQKLKAASDEFDPWNRLEDDTSDTP